MAALGLLLLVVAGIVATITGLANSGSDSFVPDFSIMGLDANASSGRIFLYGAVTGAVGMLGLNMLLAGLGRGLKNRVQHHREDKQQRSRTSELEAERNRLQEQLENERRSQGSTGATGATNNDSVDLTDTPSGQHHRS